MSRGYRNAARDQDLSSHNSGDRLHAPSFCDQSMEDIHGSPWGNIPIPRQGGSGLQLATRRCAGPPREPDEQSNAAPFLASRSACPSPTDSVHLAKMGAARVGNLPSLDPRSRIRIESITVGLGRVSATKHTKIRRGRVLSSSSHHRAWLPSYANRRRCEGSISQASGAAGRPRALW